MLSFLGKIESLDVPDPEPGVEPQPDDATLVASMEAPNVGTITLKLYPLALKEFALGPCRVGIDQG